MTLSIWSKIDEMMGVQHASPDDRIAQLEAELIAKDQQIVTLRAESEAERARSAALEQQVASLTKQVAQ